MFVPSYLPIVMRMILKMISSGASLFEVKSLKKQKISRKGAESQSPRKENPLRILRVFA